MKHFRNTRVYFLRKILTFLNVDPRSGTDVYVHIQVVSFRRKKRFQFFDNIYYNQYYIQYY